MRKIILYSLVLLSVLVSGSKARAQVFASVELNRKSVYVQQPFHVTITVYTRTWFTAPLEFGNLQIPNAFIVPFDDTQPGMFTVGGKQYPGVQFYYIVFPYQAGEFTVPALEITAQSPPEGSSVGRKVVLKTTPQHYTVKDVPAELKKQGTWFVARNVTLQEHWEPALKELKTGDVLKRTLTVRAMGTLPQFIPNLSKQEEADWASTYPKDPVLTDTRGGGDANGQSVQTTTYLLEKAGDFTLPAISLSFWNPYTSRMETKSTPLTRIHVAENPNLGILTTLKDSLAATVPTTAAPPAEKAPFRILGMTWYAFLGSVIAVLFVMYVLTRLGIRAYRYLHRKRKEYLRSEKYLFRQFLKADNTPQTFLTTLYNWWNNFDKKTSASVSATLRAERSTDESKAFSSYFEKTLHGEQTPDTGPIKASLSELREKAKEEKKSEGDEFPL